MATHEYTFVHDNLRKYSIGSAAPGHSLVVKFYSPGSAHVWVEDGATRRLPASRVEVCGVEDDLLFDGDEVPLRSFDDGMYMICWTERYTVAVDGKKACTITNDKKITLSMAE